MDGTSEVNQTAVARPDFYRFHQGDKVLPLADIEYETRLAGLRRIMADTGVDACVLTSMHNIAYYSGFLYCAFGRPYAQVVTQSDTVTISAGIDAAQPWRRCYGDNITYTDWQRNNYWRAILSITGPGKAIGFEGDHLSIAQMALLDAFLAPAARIDVAPATMTPTIARSSVERLSHISPITAVGEGISSSTCSRSILPDH